MGLSRGVNSTLKAALAGHFCPVALFELVLPAETIRAHSGRGNLSWDAKTWIGIDRLARFAGPEELPGLARARATVEMVLSLEAWAEADGAANRNAPLTVWWGATTLPGGVVLIGQPMLLYAGYVDDWRRRLDRSGAGGAHGLTIGLMPGPSARDGFPVVHSPEAQQALHATDTGARHFVNAVKRASNPPLFPEP